MKRFIFLVLFLFPCAAFAKLCPDAIDIIDSVDQLIDFDTETRQRFTIESENVNPLAGQTLYGNVISLSGQKGVVEEFSRIAFGQRLGGTPLYVNQTYKTRVSTTLFTEKEDELIVKIYDAKTNEILAEEVLLRSHDVLGEAWQQKYILNGRLFSYEGSLTQKYGLNTEIVRARPSSILLGKYQSDLIVAHSSANDKYRFLLQLRNSNKSPEAHDLYSLDFTMPLPWQISQLQRPRFHTPCNDHIRRSIQETDVLANISWMPTWTPPDAQQREALKKQFDSPELESHQVLDNLVEELRGDPMAIATFVQNEIGLIQGISAFRETDASDLAINPGKVDRSALGTLLEKQGSPWEQSALLVYLLRKAGFAAVYVQPTPQTVFMPRDQLSNMLGIQLRDAIGPLGTPAESYLESNPDVIPVNYPWVAFYHEQQKEWIHLFPWLQDVHTWEGHDPYSILPNGYRTATQWIRKYLENDAAIMKHVGPDGNDTAAIVFRRFLGEHLSMRNMTFDDVGMHFFPQKHQFAKWNEFPKPFIVNGKLQTISSLSEKPDLFSTLRVEISSVENPGKKIAIGTVKVSDVLNKPLFVYFSAIGDQKNSQNHRLYLELLSEDTYRRELQTDSTDKNFRIEIVYERQAREKVSLSWHLADSTQLNASYTIEKGVTAAICVRPNRVTPEMLTLHANTFATINAEEDQHKRNGILAFLTGMTYFKKLSDSEKLLRELHNVYQIPIFGAGLSKLSPDFSSRSANISPQGLFVGDPDLLYPQVDMNIFSSKNVFNNSTRPDRAFDPQTITQPFHEMVIVDGSANEHQIINDVYGDKHAISTVKLLQLSHKRGRNFLPVTRTNLNDQTWVKKQAGSQWKALEDAIETGGEHVIAYMTPGDVKSDSGDYEGMGSLIFGPGRWSALISGNKTFLYGGYGSRLPSRTFSSDPQETLYLENGAQNEFRVGGIPSQTLRFPNARAQDAKHPDYQSSHSSENWERMDAQSRLGESTQAQTGPRIYDRGSLHAATQGEHKGFFETVGDPVCVVTGAFYLDEIDITLPGALALELRRTYNSENSLPGDFGYGWKSNIVSHLVVDEKGELISAAESDGTVLVYRRDPEESTWSIDVDRNPQLTNDTVAGRGGTSNAFHNRIKKHGDTYTLTSSNGSLRIYSVRSFPVSGMERRRPYLISWQDSEKNQLQFEYGEDPVAHDYGRIRYVHAENGNGLRFAYDSEQRITSASAVDGRSVQYVYDTQGDLVQVVRSDTSIVEYKYEIKAEPKPEKQINWIYSTHRLIEEIKPGDRRLVNEYDDKGRVIRQRATVSRDSQLHINATFNYVKEATASDPIAITEVVAPRATENSAEAKTRYHIFKGLVYRVVDPLGHAISRSWYLDQTRYFDAMSEQVNEDKEAFGFYRSLKDSTDKRGLKTTYRYDQNGNVIWTAFGGGVTQFVYDEKSNLLLETKHETSYAAKKTMIRYDERYPYLPSEIVHSTNDVTTQKVSRKYADVSGAKGLLLTEQVSGRAIESAIETRFAYDGRGFINERRRLSGTVDPDVFEVFEHNSLGLVSRITMPSGGQTEHTYDVMGRLTSTTHRDRHGKMLSHLTLRYDANGQLIERHQPHEQIPQSEFWHYDRAGRVIAHMATRVEKAWVGGYPNITVPLSYDRNHLEMTLYEYDIHGNTIVKVDPNGNVTNFSYNEINQLVRLQNGDSSEAISYEPGGQISQITTAAGATTRTEFTANGLIRHRQNPDDSIDEWVYDSEGRPVSETISGVQWTIAHDDLKQTETRTHVASGQKAIRTFDGAGRLVAFQDSEGYVFGTRYDSLGRIIWERDAEGFVTTRHYNPQESEITITNALGEILRTKNDELNRPSFREKFDRNGLRASFVGNEYSGLYVARTFRGESKEERLLTENIMDGQGRILWSLNNISPNTKSLPFRSEGYKYDAAGNLVEKEDALGRLTKWSYDTHNRLLSEIDHAGRAKSYEHDKAGNLIGILMPNGNQWKAAFSPWGAKTFEEWSLPNGQSAGSSMQYAGGRLKHRRDGRGIDFEYAYDEHNRLKLIRTKDSLTSYEYDGRGLITRITEQSDGHATEITRTYDGNRRLIQEKVFLDQEEMQNWQQNWDGAGRRIELRNNAMSIAYNHNADGQITQVQPSNFATPLRYQYGEDGTLLDRIRPWGSSTVKKLDTIGRVFRVENKVYNDTFEEALEWSKTGQILSHALQHNQSQRSVKTPFVYDDQNKLQTNDRSRVQLSEVYDDAGLLISQKHPESSVTKTFSWDSFGRLKGVKQLQNDIEISTWTAIYDGLGRRLRTTFQQVGSAPIVHTSSYDPEVEFLELGLRVEQDFAVSQFWKIYGPDLNGSFGALQGTGGLEAIIDSSTGLVHAVINDLLGNVIGSVSVFENSKSQIEWNFDATDPFGKPAHRAFVFTNLDAEGRVGEQESALRALLQESHWRSRRLDPTGLYNLGARYYDPSSHRFLSADPEGFGKGDDLYAYAYGDPINYLDPDGRLAQEVLRIQGSQVHYAMQASNHVIDQHGTRILGGYQAFGGALQMAAGGGGLASIPATGPIGGAFGAFNVALGADNLWAGANAAWTGVPSQTVTNLLLQTTGMSPGAATATEIGVNIGAGLGMGVAARVMGSVTRNAGNPSLSAAATSSKNGYLLREHLRQLEDYGEAGVKLLENGRIRYYGPVEEASIAGKMAGRRLVREWSPENRLKRTWHETLDHAGEVRQVRPQQGSSKTHYRFDAQGTYEGKW